jgi:hypothetical protein
MMKTVSPRPGAAPFDWRIYADATSAGLSTLIPLPFVDRIVESIFRRRMPRAICRARDADADHAALSALGRQKPWFTSRGCLLFPMAVVFYLLKRLSRKVFYVLTIHESANALSAYWHRAFLIDHLVRADHLSPGRYADAVLSSFDQALDETDTRALSRIARQFIHGVRRILRLLPKAVRRGSDTTLRPQAAFLKDQWDLIVTQLVRVAERYDQTYAAVTASPSEEEQSD